MRPALVAACLLGLATLAHSPLASAQHASACRSALEPWASACAAGGPPIVVAECPARHVIFAVGPGRLRVDVSRRPERAFVRVGELGLSPVGEIADWRQVPEADRRAFDALVHCASERPEPLLDALAHAPALRGSEGTDAVEPLRAPDGAVPWRVVLAALLAIAALRLRRRAVPSADSLALVALCVATLLARRALLPEAYFHQNGQGPYWIAHALGEPSHYGPGYAQVFFWAASTAADPDGAVFWVQSVLCALVPAAVFAIARGVGAPRPVAWSLAIAVALSPMQARLAQSESYFATSGALLALAGASLALVQPDASARANLATSGAAGLLIAQASLIHPLSWLAGALVPAIVVVGEGTVKERARLAAIATGTIAAIVIATAGKELLHVLTGPLGVQWLGPGSAARTFVLAEGLVHSGMVALAAGVIAVCSRRFRRAASATLVLSLIAAVSVAANMVRGSPEWVQDAYHWLYLAPAIGPLAALARELCASVSGTTRGHVTHGLAAGALLGAALAWHAVTSSRATELPTDAREAALMRAWRSELPSGSVVAHLERAGRQMVSLPLYRGRHGQLRLVAEQSPPALAAFGTSVFYYRSSLCSTIRGRAFCESMEADYELEALHTAVLPSIPSMPGLDYDRRNVEVGLYRVKSSTTDARSSERREGR